MGGIITYEPAQGRSKIKQSVCGFQTTQANFCKVKSSFKPASEFLGEDGIEFLADTGANVILTNKKPPKGTEILKEDIYIGTASADKLMHFKQKYNLQLQAPSGDVFDFEGMLLSEEAKQPLLPVGVMCDAGVLFLFSKECMRVYREEGFKVSGTKIAEELRDEAKLYKWTLYPVKTKEHIVATAKALLQEGKRRLARGESLTVKEIRQGLQALVCRETDCQAAAAKVTPSSKRLMVPYDLQVSLCNLRSQEDFAALSQSYREKIDERTLRHHRLNHLGGEIIDIVFGTTIPRKQPCVDCINTKGHIHKTKRAPKDEEYQRGVLPGEMFETDHQGPYAGSIGDSKYLQLFVDRSESKWWKGYPSKSVSDHRKNLDDLRVESLARSRRKIRIIRSDNNGPFISAETREFNKEHAILAEYSAPYDHTKHVERLIRTVFENVKVSQRTGGFAGRYWGPLQKSFEFVATTIQIFKQPDGKYLSRLNLLEGNSRRFPPDRYRAPGTLAFSLIPEKSRKGGKGPTQETHEPGVIIGYLPEWTGYLFLCLSQDLTRKGKVYKRPFSMITTIEGVYPMSDQRNWLPEDWDSPSDFMPTLEALLNKTEWEKYNFSEEEEQQAILQLTPNIPKDTQDILNRRKFTGEPDGFGFTPGVTPNYFLRPRPPADSAGKEPETLRKKDGELPSREQSEDQPDSSPTSPPHIPPLVEIKQEERTTAEETQPETPTLTPVPSITIQDHKYEHEPETLSSDQGPPPLEEPATRGGQPLLSEPMVGSPLDEYVCNENLVYPKVGDIIFSIETNETSETPRWIIQKFRRLENLTKKGNLKRTPDGFIRAQWIAPGDLDDVVNTEIYDLPRDNIDLSEEACKRRCDRSNGIEPIIAQAYWKPISFEALLFAVPSPCDGLTTRIRQASTTESTTNPSDIPPETPVPTSEAEVQGSKFRDQYERARDSEMATLEKNNTWILVDKASIPKGTTIVGSKMVYAHKTAPDGKVTKVKARLVAKGFSQKWKQDYWETYASVINFSTFRMLLAHYNHFQDWFSEQWDTEAAFLQPSLGPNEVIYMQIPPPWNKKHLNKVFKLLKTLYGLKQSARAWQNFVSTIMVRCGGKQCPRDTALYYFIEGKAQLYIGTHIDDFGIIGSPLAKQIRDRVWQDFTKSCQRINNLGPISYFLKTRIQVNREAGILKISLEGFLDTAITRFDLGQKREADTPSIMYGENADITPDDLPKTDEEKEEASKFPIREVTGCCWWAVHICRPDIHNPTLRISRWQNNPSKKLWQWCLQLLRYLNKTKHLGLVYRRQETIDHVLTGAADASFSDVISADPTKRNKSTLCWMLFYLGALIIWGVSTSTRVLGSSCEAEIGALIKLQKDNRWIIIMNHYLRLHDRIGTTPTLVREDNQAAITTSGEKLFHDKCKHFDLAWDILRECIALGEIKLWWCETIKQFADIGTKHNVPKAVFLTHRNTIMGGPDLQNRFDDACAQLLIQGLNELDATAAVYNGKRANICARLSNIEVTYPDMDGKDNGMQQFS